MRPRILGRVGHWLGDRLGISVFKGFIDSHKVPEEVTGRKGWMYIFGNATMVVFVAQIVTGLALASLYIPSTENAYESLVAITEQASLGWFLRALHFFGASAMVILVLAHATRVYLTGSYKYPREMNWITGVLLLLLVFGMAFTGQLLRWDNDGVWTVVVAAKFATRVPWIGPSLSEFILAGDSFSDITLSRFYALHVLIFPALIVLLIGLHLFLLIYHGVSEPPKAGHPVEPSKYRQWYKQLKEKGRPYFPDMAWREWVFVGVVFTVILGLAVGLGPVELVGPPDPTALYAEPQPDWYLIWYYGLLWLKPRGFETFFMFYLPAGVVLVMLLLPLVANKGERSPSRRPWAIAIVILAWLSFLGLIVLGYRAPWEPDTKSAALSAQLLGTERSDVLEGAVLFRELGCQLCHRVLGRGGLYGPDLTDVALRLSPEEIAVRTIDGIGDMPAYRDMLSLEQLDRIVIFLRFLKPLGGS